MGFQKIGVSNRCGSHLRSSIHEAVDRASGWGSCYVRHIVFTVNQHEDFHDNTTDVLIQNHDRPQDDFTMHIPAHTNQTVPNILAEIHDYVEEQAYRQRDNGARYVRRMGRIGGA